MPDSRAPLTRRSLLGLGVGGVALLATGCDAVEDVLGGDDEPVTPTGTTPTAAAPDDDEGLAAEVGAALAGTGALAVAIAAAVPALRPVGRRLGRLHAVHAERLGWSGTVDQPAVRPGRAAARQQLLQAESDLQVQLAAAAERAASGALAQTFASMAAAVAQQRAVLG